jgi:hypothetical protein
VEDEGQFPIGVVSDRFKPRQTTKNHHCKSAKLELKRDGTHYFRLFSRTVVTIHRPGASLQFGHVICHVSEPES